MTNITIINPRTSSNNELKGPEDLAREIEKARDEETIIYKSPFFL